MTSPALVLKRVLPDIDERSWMMIMAIGGFAVLAMKEIALPMLLVVVGTVLGVVVLRRLGQFTTEWLLYALVAYLPFHGILSSSSSVAGLNLTNILLALILTTYVWTQRAAGTPMFEVTPITKAIGLFSGLAAVSLLRAGASYGTWYVTGHLAILLHWLLPMGCGVVAFWIVRDHRTLKTVLALIAVAVVVVALMAMWEYLDRADSSFDRSRVQGIAGEANLMGAFFVYAMFPFLGAFLTAPARRVGWVWLLPFLLCVRGVMVTFSRGAYLALAIAGLTACWVRQKRLFFAAVALGIIMLLHPAFLPAGIRYRMNMTWQHARSALSGTPEPAQQLETSAAARVEIWKGALAMIADHPFVGVGFGAFPSFLPYYTNGRIGYLNAHNSFLMIAAEMGVPMLLLFLAVLVLVWRSARWLYRHTADVTLKAMALGVLAGLAGLVVANLFTVCLTAVEVAGYFWILCGLVMRAVVLEQQAQRGQPA